LLRRYIGRGKGVAVKSYPSLNKGYFRKVQELKADYIFILDKPVVSKEFFEEVEKVNIPIVWIDHHALDKDQVMPDFVHYYNPLFNKDKKSEPVTYICYKISDREEDQWISLVGCIADKFIPDFYDDIRKKYPELMLDSKDPFELFYKSEIGKVSKILSFALKDRTTNVIYMQNFLIKSTSPYDILNETKENKTIHYRYKQISKKYGRLLEKAKEVAKKNEKILFFKFGGDLSISGDLASELNFLYPKKIIVVAYVAGVRVNLSLRGEGVRTAFLKSIEGLEDATGGGHEVAVGGKIKAEDLEKFKKTFEKKVH